MTFSFIPRRFKNVLAMDPEVLDSIARSYSSANEADKARLEEQFSFALHDVRMAGVWKRTNPRRLRRTEEAILALVPREGQAKCRILDIGASDGGTTVELLGRLRSCWGPEVSAVMSDINFCLERYTLGPVVEYRATGGETVFVRVGRLVFRTAKPTKGDSSSVLKQIYRRVRKTSDRLCGNAWDLLGSRMRSDGRISLISPRASACHGLEPHVLDCLIRDSSLVGAFDVVRSSNILNISYFSSEEFNIALSSLHAYLKDGGCLVVSRSEGDFGEETEHGTAWIKRGLKFVLGSNFGRGSEIKDLVDSFRAR